jgi:uncharacterized protein (DUF488 family)
MMPAGREPRPQARWPVGTIFTAGHSNVSAETFLALLRTYDIECVVDIRTVPRSRHNPQYNADALASVLAGNGIEYAPLQALGGLRHPRKDSPNTGWRNVSFRGYADYMQTPSFAEGLERLIEISRSRRTAIMCAEAVPWRCHRSLVADALVVRGIAVTEILSQTSWRPHTLTNFAHVEGIDITYPPTQPALV